MCIGMNALKVKIRVGGKVERLDSARERMVDRQGLNLKSKVRDMAMWRQNGP